MIRSGVSHSLTFFVDGACRNNGRWDRTPVAAAAACLIHPQGTYDHKTRVLGAYPRPTNQRAELVAIKLALEWALEECKKEYLHEKRVSVRIRSDSQYAVNCMNQWLARWVHHGWIGGLGDAILNRDLLEALLDSQDALKEVGQGRVSVGYAYVPREQNTHADRHAKAALDKHLKT